MARADSAAFASVWTRTRPKSYRDGAGPGGRGEGLTRRAEHLLDDGWDVPTCRCECRRGSRPRLRRAMLGQPAAHVSHPILVDSAYEGGQDLRLTAAPPGSGSGVKPDGEAQKRQPS